MLLENHTPVSVLFFHPATPAHPSPLRCSAAPPPEAKPMPKGGHFRHPGRWWQPCVTPYFADLGVGDMRGARASNIHRHPGGGGRPSAPMARPRSPHRTPYYIMCQNFSIISGVIYATTTCNLPFMFFYGKNSLKNLVVAASLSNFIP